MATENESVINYRKKSVLDLPVSEKRILLRCDFNVPLEKATGEITDTWRIKSALPTINHLLGARARVIACSHLGRPKGERDDKLSLKAVAGHLSDLLGAPVKMAPGVTDQETVKMAEELRPGEIMLLENLRFEKGEEKNDPAFAKTLADMADIFVSDAFGSVHRAHASTVGVADYLPAVSGFLLKKELDLVGGALTKPAKPFVVILGGSKVSDKLGVTSNLLGRANTLIIGGGMAYTFIKADGGDIGKSLCETKELGFARRTLDEAKRLGVKIMLPVDTIAAEEFSAEAKPVTINSYTIPDEMMGLDIGPRAARQFADEIMNAGTVIWNGPMGVFEFPKFSHGTYEITKALSESAAISIIGGGDSAAAVRRFGFEDTISHISTGGGASLELLEGKELPGVACLLDR